MIWLPFKLLQAMAPGDVVAVTRINHLPLDV